MIDNAAYDPEILVSWSDDGGKTWSNWIKRSFGQVGEYLKLVKYYRCGISRNRVYRIRCSAPVKVQINGAKIELIKCAS